MICMARILGAPVSVPAGKQARSTSSALLPSLTCPDTDEVSRSALEHLDRESFLPLRSLTVGEFREYLLQDLPGEDFSRLHRAILPELVDDLGALIPPAAPPRKSNRPAYSFQPVRYSRRSSLSASASPKRPSFPS